MNENPQFLEIGQYLGRGVRTVQRYKAQLKLPVGRSEGRTI